MSSSTSFVITQTPFISSSLRSPSVICPSKRRRAFVSVPPPSSGNPFPSIVSQNDGSPNADSTTSKNITTTNQPLPKTSPLNATPPRAVVPKDCDALTEEPSSEQDPPIINLSFGSFSISVPSVWLLYAVPFMWGSFAPAVRLLFAQQPHQQPALFNSERLLLSTIVYVPVLLAEINAFRNRASTQSSDVTDDRFAFFPAGLELGVYVFLANVAQVIGLQQTSAGRAAFLVQLQTVIVPVLSGLLGLDKISPKTWMASIVAVAGVALLSSDKGHGTVSSFTGDSLEVLSALFFSTYIIRLGKYCNSLPANPLVATKIAVQAILSVGWVIALDLGDFFRHTPTHIPVDGEQVVPWTFATIAISIGVVAWTGLMSSALSGWLQTKGQQGVPASEAVVIFATQPLWASGLAALLLGESFGPRGLGGGALIIAATLLASRKSDDGNKQPNIEKQD